MKLLGFDTVVFASQGIEWPISGRTFGGYTVPGVKADSTDPFPLTSAGASIKLYSHTTASGKSLTLGILGAYETGWKEGTKSVIAAPTINYRW